MEFLDSKIEGCHRVELDKHGDERGFFTSFALMNIKISVLVLNLHKPTIPFLPTEDIHVACITKKETFLKRKSLDA